MRRDSSSGFTLIELLIVISIIGVLAAVLLPAVIGGRNAANVAADAAQLRNSHFAWFQLFKMKNNQTFPTEGGHRFVLQTWTSGLVEKTPENFDKYFSPGARDNDGAYQDKRKAVLKGENPWQTINDTSSEDTHYVGRAKKERRGMDSGTEALMATDNEGGWTFPDGDINILLGDGNVRQLSYMQMQEIYQLGPFDKGNPIVMYGPNSPITECQKLDN
jgi:prepilin-type N-terminal cleavage/methylation domain-containing protein